MDFERCSYNKIGAWRERERERERELAGISDIHSHIGGKQTQTDEQNEDRNGDGGLVTL